MSNWIEDRAGDDRIYFSHGPGLWKDIKENLEFGVAEYHKHYGAAGVEEITFEPCGGDDSNCLRLKRPRSTQSNPAVLEVRFDVRNLCLTWEDGARTPTGKKSSLTLAIRESRQGVQLLNGTAPVELAELSRMILEPFLFPDGRRPPTK